MMITVENLLVFIANHGLDTEEDEKWTCPKCGAVNFGIYYSHDMPCANCKEYTKPQRHTGHGGPGSAAEYAQYKKDLESVEKRIEDVGYEISELEEEMMDLLQEKKEIKEIMRGLK